MVAVLPRLYRRWRPRGGSVANLLWPEQRATARVRAALEREELAGYRYVLYGWLCTLAAIAIYLTVSIPSRRLPLYYAVLLGFAVLGLLGEWVRRRRPAYARLSMAGVLLVGLPTLAALLIVPAPFIADPSPPQMSFRLANFLYLYAVVVASVLSYSPGIVLWTGAVAALAWTIGFTAIYQLPSTVSAGSTHLIDLELGERLAIYLDPHYMSLASFRTQIFILMLTSALLAFAVWRARLLVYRQMIAESARANLARYFSPDLVDELAAAGQPQVASHADEIGVLFVDIVGFTALSENLPPERLIRLLRSFHARMLNAVFAYGGTIDKYIGDEVMATFGTPRRRPDDASSMFACAVAMLAEIDRWNAKRALRGAAPIRVGIGMQYGRVVLGNVGGERCLEFTAIGDTVNVASRLERLTREYGVAVVAGAEAIAAMVAEGGAVADLPLRFRPNGSVNLRGRAAPVETWVAPWPDSLK